MNKKQMIKEVENKKEEIKEERQGLKEDSHAAYLKLGSEMALDYVIGLLQKCSDD